jgi:hypothetical protein
MIEKYRQNRRQHLSKRNPKRTIKGATVNRELECLRCMFEFAVRRKYVPENPASGVRHYGTRANQLGASSGHGEVRSTRPQCPTSLSTTCGTCSAHG